MFNSPADGMAPWGYQYAVGNPYDDYDAVPDGKLTDCFAVYPSRNGIIPTLLWEAFREGIDDCRYASTMYNLLVRVRGLYGDAPMLREMRKWMEEQKVDYVYVANNLYDRANFKPMLVYGENLAEQLADRPNLQRLRRQFAEKIIAVKEAYPNMK